MVVTNTITSSIVTDILTKFDAYTHIAVGDGVTAESPSDTALANETFRETFADSVKDTGAGTYLWSIQLGLTEDNGNDVSEIGVFDAASAGNMALRKLLTNSITKTSDKEVWIDVQVDVVVTSI